MLNLLAGAYRNFDPAIQGDYYRDELTRMVGSHGRGAVEAGLKAALRDDKREDSSFVPTVPVILGYVRGEAQRQPLVTPRRGADSTCSACQGSGWKPSEKQPSRVERCHCWQERAVSA